MILVPDIEDDVIFEPEPVEPTAIELACTALLKMTEKWERENNNPIDAA